MEALIFQACVAAIAAGGLVHNLLIERYQNFLMALCRNLPTGTYKTEIHSQRRLWRKRTHSFHGYFHNRLLEIRHTFQPQPFSRKPGKELELQLGLTQKFWLRLLKEKNDGVTGEDLQVGDRELDSAYVIHSNQPDAAREFLTYPNVRSQFERLKLHFVRMEFYQGRLRVSYSGPAVSAFQLQTFMASLEAMARIADFYEARSASFRLILVPVQELCPYCRASFQRENERIVECPECRTSIHRSCWDQNGQCTTYGCNSRIAN